MTSLLYLVPVSIVMLAWFLRWRRHAVRSSKVSGYIPPRTSYFAKGFYLVATRVLNFLTIGPVKVIDRQKVPAKGRVVLVTNHQYPVDFAVARQASGRHYRALGDAAQFPGLFGMLAAWAGVVTFTFKTKEDRAAGEQAGVNIIAEKRSRFALSPNLALVLALILGGLFLIHLGEGDHFSALLMGFALVVLGCRKGGETTLGIAPQGALMPDNELKREEFRAGCVRMAKAAAVACGEPVYMVPMAFHYSRDPKDAHWSQRFLNATRSKFLGLRNPKHWDASFKTDLDALVPEDRARAEAQRAAKWDAYKNSQVTLYRAVAVVGDPIDVSTLPADPVEAIEQVRLAMLALLERAKQA